MSAPTTPDEHADRARTLLRAADDYAFGAESRSRIAVEALAHAVLALVPEPTGGEVVISGEPVPVTVVGERKPGGGIWQS